MKIINLNEEASRMNLSLEITSNSFKNILKEKNAVYFFNSDNSEIIVSDILEIKNLLDRLEVENIQMLLLSKEYGLSTSQMVLVLNDLISQNRLDGLITSFGEYVTKNGIKTRLIKLIEEDEKIDLIKLSQKLGLPVEKFRKIINEFEEQFISKLKPFNQIKIVDISYENGLSEKIVFILLKELIANNKISGKIDMINKIFIQDQVKSIPSVSLSNQDIKSNIGVTSLPKQSVTFQRKDPLLAAVLSFLLTGLGQIYIGKVERGVAFLFGGIVIGSMLGYMLGVFGIFLAFFIWLYSAYDANELAKQYNLHYEQYGELLW